MCYTIVIMIIAIDIGATKTLLAVADQDGKVLNKIKFSSTKDYQEYIQILSDNIKKLSTNRVSIISIGSAGSIDRKNGIIKNSPNLHWINKPIVHDISKMFSGIKVIIENDANLAGLSEAHALSNINQRVMYVTFSTGIGTGFVVNGLLEPYLLDAEGGHMVFEYKGKMMDWEEFAAGKAIVHKYGKTASELENKSAWNEIAKNMAMGIVDNCAVFMPDIVIIGGGVGTYFYKYADQLNRELSKLITKSVMIKQPKIIGAQNAEEAVVLGCIINAKQNE